MAIIQCNAQLSLNVDTRVSHNESRTWISSDSPTYIPTLGNISHDVASWELGNSNFRG